MKTEILSLMALVAKELDQHGQYGSADDVTRVMASVKNKSLRTSQAQNIGNGNQGKEVGAWQQFLASQGFPVTADGVFGPATTNATKQWQQKYNLVPDGIVGFSTTTIAQALGYNPSAAPAQAPQQQATQQAPAQHQNTQPSAQQAPQQPVTAPSNGSNIVPPPGM